MSNTGPISQRTNQQGYRQNKTPQANMMRLHLEWSEITQRWFVVIHLGVF